MRRTGLAIVLLILAVLVAIGWLLARQATISALDQPGRIETFVATHAKRWLIAKAARAPLPPEPAKTADTVSDGQMYYGSLCAGCHGYDARTPTPLGLALNPHAPSLAAPGVQRWSDAELFVIIRDGIRLSGMPGFGGSERSDQIWALVHYVRSLPTATPRR
jgi:mono/diheme cytochrome c family protein